MHMYLIHELYKNSAYVLLWTVQRAKLCLDFAATFTLIHFLVTTLYSKSLPTSFFWWLLQIAGTWIMAAYGEKICMERELEPILLNKKTGNGGGKGSQDDLEMQRLDPQQA
jgi:hypothetical protein